MKINDYQINERKCTTLPYVKFYLINAGRIREIEESLLGKCHNNFCRWYPLMHTKNSGLRITEKKNIFLIANISSKCQLIAKGNTVKKPGKHHPNQMIKVNSPSDKAYQHYGVSPRINWEKYITSMVFFPKQTNTIISTES